MGQSKKLLKKVLLETKEIDWNQKVLIMKAAQGDTSDVLLDILSEKQRKFMYYISCNYFKPKEECIKTEFQ